MTIGAILLLSSFPSAAAADKGVLGDLHWRSIGPGQSGGRVTAVAGTNADPLLYSFGAADGGVFRTDNGGVTWSDLWARQPVAAIGAIAIAPSDKRVVWVGTGESKPRKRGAIGARDKALYDALSSNPRNSEDDMYRPDSLRERIQTLQQTMSLSQGPPSAAQIAEAAEVKARFDSGMAEYHAQAEFFPKKGVSRRTNLQGYFFRTLRSPSLIRGVCARAFCTA